MSNEHSFFDSPDFNANGGWADWLAADTFAFGLGDPPALGDAAAVGDAAASGEALILPLGGATAPSSEPQGELMGEFHREMLHGEEMEVDEGLATADYGFRQGNDTTEHSQALHTDESMKFSSNTWNFQVAIASFEGLPANYAANPAAIGGDSSQPTETPPVRFESTSAGDATAEQQQCASQCVGSGVGVCETDDAGADAISNANTDAKDDATAEQQHESGVAGVGVAVGDIDGAGAGGTGLTFTGLLQQIKRNKRQARASGFDSARPASTTIMQSTRNPSHDHLAEVSSQHIPLMSNHQFDASTALPLQQHTSELIGGASASVVQSASAAVQPEEASKPKGLEAYTAGDKPEPLKRQIREIREKGNKRAKLIGPAASAPTPTIPTTPTTSTNPSPSAPASPTAAVSSASSSDASAASESPHSRLLVSGLPKSLPPLPPSLAPPYLPCVEGQQRAAPYSSSFPPTTAPLQTLHMDVWGPACVSGQGRERYFLLVVDDYTRPTTVFPLRSKGQIPDVLIPWIRAVRLQLRERFRQDLPDLRLHSDRGGEFSSNLLREFCRAEGILHSFMLPESPQQNRIDECHIGLVMEVARTSMIHAAAPHFLWQFADGTLCICSTSGPVSPCRRPRPHCVGGAGAGDPTEPRAAEAGGTGAGGEGAGSTGEGGAGAGGARAVDPGAGGAGAGCAVSGGTSAVSGVPSSTDLTSPLLCPPPDQLQPPLQPASPLPAPSPYTEQTGGLTEHREPESHPALPVCTGRRVPRLRPPPIPGTHTMALRPSYIPQRVPLPPPPESSLCAVPNPQSDLARPASPTVSHFLATVVTDTSFESTTASALVAELVDFADACRLDYATALVAESESASPPSIGGECALTTDVLEDRQEDFECLAGAVPRFASMLLAPEGDPDAPGIPTPRSYGEAITCPYSSQWQAAMDAEMASWKVKRPPSSRRTFKVRYVARGFCQRQKFDYFQTFSPTPKMTTLWVLLHVAAQRDYELHSLDFSTAFLQGSLHEEIWLRRPPGFTGSSPAGTQ
ncbi:unnamed protein product [Closterium sp. NIES-54]